MRKIFLLSMASFLITTFSLSVFAEEDMEANESYSQAYDECHENASNTEIIDEETGENNWNEIFENCMQGKGFHSYEDTDESSYELDTEIDY